ncbi:NAD+ synthase [Geitlerinema sp. PCC 9228]|jgi:NAD+ synthetase|uniref:NAD+ synthase n=1 Tax=Geitlerinema sp. PCC 9228 TaxID=111611 RepID=UPI0008F9B1E8|nr:NAD+ synthase [Geitlerinema sp. PCC 9228]
MKIAIAQLNPTIGDLPGNAQKILTRAQTAAENGARLLLTPELSLCGYPPKDLLLYPDFIAAMHRELQQLARQLPSDLAVLVGTATENPQADSGGKPLFNSIAWLQNGEIGATFHKRLLPTYDVFDEQRYFDPGKTSNCLNLDNIRIGVTICEDLWNDEQFWGKRHYPCNPIEDLANQGVDLIVNLSASPYSLNKPKLREAMLGHSAQRYRCPIIYANQVGGNDDLIFDGCSLAFDRTGKTVARGNAMTEALFFLEFNSTNQQLTSQTTNAFPASEEAELWSALVLGVRDYVRKCGFQKVVLGLSGGIDSSLVAAIATCALGAENVVGVLMSSPYTSDRSVTDATQCAQNLGIATHHLPIAGIMEAYDRSLKGVFAGLGEDVTEENLQSRIRGNLLMALSNKFGYLLLSTGNKSEMAVGYCTLYGDMNGGLAVIADVPKTRVYALCHWLNQQQATGWQSNCERCLHTQAAEIIPQNILEKPPSAELKPDQADSDSLPSYEILDEILDRFIHKHQSRQTIVEAGLPAEVVDKAINLANKAEFKRRQAPPGLKVTDRAFGTGWRMPVAAQKTLPNPEKSKHL